MTLVACMHDPKGKTNQPTTQRKKTTNKTPPDYAPCLWSNTSPGASTPVALVSISTSWCRAFLLSLASHRSDVWSSGSASSFAGCFGGGGRKVESGVCAIACHGWIDASYRHRHTFSYTHSTRQKTPTARTPVHHLDLDVVQRLPRQVH